MSTTGERSGQTTSDPTRQTGQTYNQSVDLGQATQRNTPNPPNPQSLARELLGQTINSHQQFEPQPQAPAEPEETQRLLVLYPSELNEHGDIIRFRDPRRPQKYYFTRCRADQLNHYLRDSVFVERRSCQAALEFLKKNRIITLLGHSGDGLSTLGLWLLKTIADEKDIDALRLYSPSEWWEAYDMIAREEEQVIFLDNMFGSSGLNDNLVSQWHPYEGFMWDYVQSKNLYIIFTSKKHLYNQGVMNKFPSSDLFSKKYVFDLTLEENKLTFDECRAMLFKHLKIRKLSQDAAENLPPDVSRLGFPLVMNQYCMVSEYQLWEHRFFMNPVFWYYRDFSCVSSSEEEVWGALLLILLSDGVLKPYDFDPHTKDKAKKERLQKLIKQTPLKDNFPPGELNAICKNMVGDYVYFDQEKQGYRFIHQVYADACMLVFGKWRWSEVAELSSLDFLFEYVLTERNEQDRIEKEMYLTYPPTYYDCLFDRFIKEIEAGNVEIMICHRTFRDPSFREDFGKYIQEEDHLGRLLKARDRKCEKGIVSLLALYGMEDTLRELVKCTGFRQLASKESVKKDIKEALETARTYQLVGIENMLKVF